MHEDGCAVSSSAMDQTEACYLFYDLLFHFHFFLFLPTFSLSLFSFCLNFHFYFHHCCHHVLICRHQTETCYLFYGPKNSTLSPHLHRALVEVGRRGQKLKEDTVGPPLLCVSSITGMSLSRCQNWKTMGKTYFGCYGCHLY